MCLQLCQVRRVLMDNDLPCDHCPPAVRNLHEHKSCAECRHVRPRKGKAALCALTQQTIPAADNCCHWNAEPVTGESVTVGPDDVAGGLYEAWGARTFTHLLKIAWVPFTVDEAANTATIPLEALAVPNVYGIAMSEDEHEE